MTSIQIFKEMVDELYDSMPNEKKIELYEEHKKDVESKNDFKKSLLKNKNDDLIDSEILNNSILLIGKRKEKANKGKTSAYNSKPMDIVGFLKSKIALMLLDSNWNFLVSGGMSLEEIGEIYSISRERVRQIENKSLVVFKNLRLLKALNVNNKINDILDKALSSTNRKRTSAGR